MLCLLRNDTVNQLQTGMLVDEGMLLVGSHNCKLALLDLTTQQPLAEVATEAGVCLLKGAQEILCCGEVTGKVELFDPSTLHCVASLDTHNAGLSDMAVVGSYLVTCGLAHQCAPSHPLLVSTTFILTPLTSQTLHLVFSHHLGTIKCYLIVLCVCLT